MSASENVCNLHPLSAAGNNKRRVLAPTEDLGASASYSADLHNLRKALADIGVPHACIPNDVRSRGFRSLTTLQEANHEVDHVMSEAGSRSFFYLNLLNGDQNRIPPGKPLPHIHLGFSGFTYGLSANPCSGIAIRLRNRLWLECSFGF
jgi:hypothetical protein